MFLPYFLLVPRCIQPNYIWILMFLHWIRIVKNTVCLLLKFYPSIINPEFVMELN